MNKKIHNGLTVEAEVNVHELKNLREFLADFPAGFNNCKTVFFASAVILPKQYYGNKELPETLMFFTSYCGPHNEHLDDIVTNQYTALQKLFSHTKNFNAGDPDSLKAFLKTNKRSNIFHSSLQGFSTEDVKKQYELKQQIDEHKKNNYDRYIDGNFSEEQISDDIRQTFGHQINKVFTLPFERPSLWKYILIVLSPFIVLIAASLFCQPILPALGNVLIFSISVLIVVLLFAVIIVLMAESQPDKTANRPADHRAYDVLQTQQSEFTNEMTSAGPLKKGIARRILYFLILKLVGFVQNWLPPIPNVTTARWTSANKGKRLVFISNFTGVTEFYIRDFIDAKKTARNINLLFSHGSGFPKTCMLLCKGCLDNPQAFMNVVLSTQHKTNFWYPRFDKLTHQSIIATRNELLTLSKTDYQPEQAAAEKKEKKPTKKEPDQILEKNDIQALIARGHDELKMAAYLLLEITDPILARKYLAQAALEITPAERASVQQEHKQDDKAIKAIQLAFSRSGLEKLGMPLAALNTFSREFNEGMDKCYRSKHILGDVGKNEPVEWNWGSAASKDPRPVHIILFCYAKDETVLNELVDAQKALIHQKGVSLIDIPYTINSPNKKEHFGFRDGIANPLMEGLTNSVKVEHPIKAGEFVLGYKNEYGRYTDSPFIHKKYDPTGLLRSSFDDYHDFGRNGTYVVFRQYKQHVHAFWNELKKIEQGNEIALAAKMIGRWPNGAPIVAYKEEPTVNSSYTPENNFEFSNTNNVATCPFGAHIRRGNPRDDKVSEQDNEGSDDIIRKRKLMRRGRIYGPPFVPDMDPKKMLEAQADDGETRGLYFISLQTNINRQFEFVQSVWVNNSSFNGLHNEKDTILSATSSDFSCPAQPLHKCYPNLPVFTELMGGGYFFMPGINAIKLLASGAFGQQHINHLEKPDDKEDRYTDQIISILKKSLLRRYGGNNIKRRFHAKTLGICKAKVYVMNDVPAELKVGLFAKQNDFDALVRFTNANRKTSADYDRGARGMAIKILNAGENVLETDSINAQTISSQDILLTTNKTLLPHNPKGQLHAMQLLFGNPIKGLLGLIKTRQLISSLLFIWSGNKRCANVLNERYFSGTPVSFGADSAIKWAAIPRAIGPKEEPDKHENNYLNKRLKRDLNAGPVYFDLVIQFSEDQENEPIEDSSTLWKTAFMKVATIELLKQDVNETKNEYADNKLSFTPWHCIPEHQPLGGNNRIRRKIYKAMASFKAIAFFLLSHLFLHNANSQVIDANICDSTNRFAITQLSSILTTNNLISIDSAVQLDRQHAFKQSPNLPVNVVDYDPYYYWFRFIIKNDKTVDRDLMLVMAPIGLREGWLYQQQQGKWQETVHTGLRIPFVKRPYYFSHNVFPIKVKAGGTDTIYLRTDASNVYKSFGFALIKPKPLRIFENKLYFFFGIMVGLLLLFLIFNIYLFFSLKEKIHLWYSLYIVLLFLIVMKNDHLDQQFLGWDSEFAYQLTPYMAIGAIALSVLMHVVDLFLKKQLHSHKKFHRWYKVIKINTLLSGFGHFIFFFTESNYKLLSLAFNWAKYSTQLAMIMIIIACIIAIRKGFKSAYFILSGLLLFLIGASQRLFFPSTTSFLFPPTTFHIGIIMETFIISFGLIFQYRIDRIKRRRLEKNYQQELHNAQLEAQAQTMKNISQEIHDNIGQVLTLVKLNLNTLDEHNVFSRKENLQQAKTGISNAINDLRHLSKSLHPERLAQLGLAEAIKSELDLLAKSSSIETKFENNLNGIILDPKVEFMLFRIVQEAVQNTIKHANANHILVEVRSHHNNFKMVVRDDGNGFDVSKTGLQGSGLLNLRNRCKLINARFELLSKVGEGTELNVYLHQPN